MGNPVASSANEILAQSKLGVRSTVNLKVVALEILKEELNNKRMLCRIV